MRAAWKMGPQNIRLILGRVQRRYWREIIQFNASEFGEEFGGSGHHLSAQRYNTLSNRRYS
jgi:hypothetical protein